MSVSHGTWCFIEKENGTVAGPGQGSGGPGLPLFLDQNEAPRTEKKLFWGRPPTPYLRVWMTPPPPPLSGGLNPPLRYWHGVEITEVRNWQDCREKGEWCGIWTHLLDFVRFSKSLPHNYWWRFNSFFVFLAWTYFSLNVFALLNKQLLYNIEQFFFHNFIVFISLFVGNRRSGIEKNDVSYVLNKDFRLSSLLTDAAAEALARKRETNAAQ